MSSLERFRSDRTRRLLRSIGVGAVVGISLHVFLLSDVFVSGATATVYGGIVEAIGRQPGRNRDRFLTGSQPWVGLAAVVSLLFVWPLLGPTLTAGLATTTRLAVLVFGVGAVFLGVQVGMMIGGESRAVGRTDAVADAD